MISVLIITKNDEDVIGDCIKSVKDLADEIVVIDGGSTDRTAEVAEKSGAKVIRNKFKDFSDQRNLALTFAHEPWVYYIDSDEQATESFISEVKLKISEATQNSNIAGFYVRRKTFYYGKNWGLTDKVERIFRKDKLKGWRGVVHETPEVEGEIKTISEPVLHYTHRNLSQMVAKTNEWSDYEAELRMKAHHPKMTTWRFARVMVTAFLGSYFKEGGYKNGTAGMVEATYQAYSMFITYAKLWEQQKSK